LYAFYRWVIRAVFAILRQSPTPKRVAFLSRQGSEVSLDFELLETALRARLPEWEFARACYRDTGSTATRIRGTLRQLRLVATSRLCIIDGYTPAVSVPMLGEDTVVIQLWHALGAIKRFGWQAVDTPAGRTGAQAQGLCMHRNYTAILAGGPGAVAVFAQAFSCPEDKIVPLGLPRMDYLLDARLAERRKEVGAAVVAQYPLLNSGRANILLAPTFRRGAQRDEMERHARELAGYLPAEAYNLIVTFHPFSGRKAETVDEADAPGGPGPAGDAEAQGPVTGAEGPAGGAEAQGSAGGGDQRSTCLIHIPRVKGIDLLELADYVITDYSAIAFEAALLRKKVLFYVPDIEDYRLSLGLNIDPEQLFPLVTFRDVASLAEFLQRDAQTGDYAASGFWEYCDSYLVQPAVGATERLAAHLVRMIA
jgi:CDP-ribitol ribitolphosphotransferase